MQTFKYVVILQYLFFILFFIINLISKHLFKWNTNNLYFGAIKNWARTVLHWNFATDVNCMSSLRFSSLLFCSFPFPSMLCYFLLFTSSVLFYLSHAFTTAGPHSGGCTNCRGVITVQPNNVDVTYNEEFYGMAMFSKFLVYAPSPPFPSPTYTNYYQKQFPSLQNRLQPTRRLRLRDHDVHQERGQLCAGGGGQLLSNTSTRCGAERGLICASKRGSGSHLFRVVRRRRRTMWW